MKNRTVGLRLLLEGLNPLSVTGDASTSVTSIAFDSRTVEPDSLFVALRGGYADGHDYLRQARAGGAVAALVEPDTPDEMVEGYDVVVRATNTRGMLAPISAAFYGHPSRDLDIVGVTGTDGKTTTCFYLHQILEACGRTVGLVSTVAVRVPGQPDRSSARQTTPESLDVQRTLSEMKDAGADTVVLETTSHALETHRVDHCEFDVGVITNITREHLDFHGSIENYQRAKAGLLRRVVQSQATKKRGIVVLNADDPGCSAVASDAAGTTITWYSAQGDSASHVFADDLHTCPDSSTFTLHMFGEQRPVRLPLPGSWNVANALAASAVAHALGCTIDTVAESLSNLRAVPGRLQTVECGQPFSVVIDYAHTPESIRSVLQEARRLTTGRVLIAFGSAGERDTEKRPLQGGIAAELADFSVFTSEDPRFEDPVRIIEEIAHGAEERGAIRGVDFDCVEERRAAIAALVALARPGDIVLLAGKGHEQSMIYGMDHRPWDEATVAREVLRELGYSHIDDEGTPA